MDADLYGTILVGGPLRIQFDDVAVLVVVFFTLLSWRLFSLPCLMMGDVSLETSPKSIMVQDMINSKTARFNLLEAHTSGEALMFSPLRKITYPP